MIFSHLFCPPLAMDIQLVSAGVSISWDTNCPDLTLACNTNLATSTWTPVTSSPVVTAGRFVITNSLADPRKFYQLRSP